jgi:hypothetical protein
LPRYWDIAILVLGLLAGCSAGAAAALLVTRTPGEDAPEAGFAHDMMVHHAQAVQMAEILRDKTKSSAMRTMAADIALTQQAQIGMMRGWLEVWGLRPSSTEPAMSWMGHPTEGLMPGVATPEEIEWPLSEVQSDSEGHGSSTTTLENASIEKLFTGELKHLNVHAAGSGDPPVLALPRLIQPISWKPAAAMEAALI